MPHGKRYLAAQKEITKPVYTLEEAVKLLKKMPQTKFDQSVELHLKLGIDPKQAEQGLRGAIARRRQPAGGRGSDEQGRGVLPARDGRRG